MTTIKLIKETNVLGVISFKIIDENKNVIEDRLGSDEFYATTVFDGIKKQLDERGGDLSKTEVVKEFSKDKKETE